MHVVVAGLAAAAAAAPVQQPPISGTLSVPGYTVIALAADGQAATALAPDGRFRVRPPAARVTLQLRAPDGTYAGPVVVGRSGSHVIVGVRAGAPLGAIAFIPRLGYATARRVAPRWIDPARWARARGDVEPFGVRSMGRELSPAPKHPPPGDRDADGVPDVFDVDDDGDFVLDEVDPQPQPEPVRAISTLSELDQPVNVDAGASRSDVETALAQHGSLTITSQAPGLLDCGGLPWCAGAVLGEPFAPHATSDQLRAGDVLLVRDAATQFAGSVGGVFATVPVIASVTDALGTTQNPGGEIVVAGDSVRLRLWRPQRRAMPADEVADDEGSWVDMGGLPMSVRLAGGAPCPADAYSDVNPILLPFGPAFLDQAPDTPSGEGTTFGYTLDIARCLAADGQTFNPGDQAQLVFAAGGAESGYLFVRPSA
jgi:hypothetical protein